MTPIALTVWNIDAAIVFLKKKKDKRGSKYIEIAVILIGALYQYMFLILFVQNPRFAVWFNPELRRMIDSYSFSTILTLSIVPFAGFILVRFIPAKKQSPIVSAIGIAAIYLGIGICVLWFVKAYDICLILYLANLIILFLKIIYILVCQKKVLVQGQTVSSNYKGLSALLYKPTNLL